MLSEELRKITDEAIEEMIKKDSQDIISEMYNFATQGKCYITYKRNKLSNRLIEYLDKQGLRFYGRQDEDDRWHTTYPQDEYFSSYNDIMIGW